MLDLADFCVERATERTNRQPGWRERRGHAADCPLRRSDYIEAASGRSVAQPGRAPSSGGGGRVFESRHSDHILPFPVFAHRTRSAASPQSVPGTNRAPVNWFTPSASASAMLRSVAGGMERTTNGPGESSGSRMWRCVRERRPVSELLHGHFEGRRLPARLRCHRARRDAPLCHRSRAASMRSSSAICTATTSPAYCFCCWSSISSRARSTSRDRRAGGHGRTRDGRARRVLPGAAELAWRFPLSFAELTPHRTARFGAFAITPHVVTHPSGSAAFAFRLKTERPADRLFRRYRLDRHPGRGRRDADLFIVECYAYDGSAENHINYRNLTERIFPSQISRVRSADGHARISAGKCSIGFRTWTSRLPRTGNCWGTRESRASH